MSATQRAEEIHDAVKLAVICIQRVTALLRDRQPVEDLRVDTEVIATLCDAVAEAVFTFVDGVRYSRSLVSYDHVDTSAFDACRQQVEAPFTNDLIGHFDAMKQKLLLQLYAKNWGKGWGAAFRLQDVLGNGQLRSGVNYYLDFPHNRS